MRRDPRYSLYFSISKERLSLQKFIYLLLRTQGLLRKPQERIKLDSQRAVTALTFVQRCINSNYRVTLKFSPFATV